MELTIEKPDIIFYGYIVQHNKENMIITLFKGHLLKLVFIENQYSTYVKSNLFDNKTVICWQNF